MMKDVELPKPSVSDKDSADNETTSLLDDSDNKRIEKIQKYRSDSHIKWYILLFNLPQFLSTLHCIISVSAVENSLINKLNLSNVEFSLFLTVLYGLSVVGTLISPYIINKMNLNKLQLYSHMILTSGQFLFFVGILIYSDNSVVISYILMYMGRILIGLANGFDEVTILSINQLWFGESKWSALSNMLIISTCELGIITARYLILPFINAFNLPLEYGFLIGVFFGLISIFSNYGIIIFENKFNKDLLSKSINIIPSFKLEYDLMSFRQFEFDLWLVIIYCALVQTILVTFSTEMTVPFIRKYNISEYKSDYIIAIASIGNLITAPLWGFVISLYSNLLLYFTIIGSLCYILSLSLYCFVTSNVSESNDYIAWLVVIFFVLGVEISMTAAFEALYKLSPKNLISISTTFNSLVFLFCSMVSTLLFGIISDAMNYNYAVGLLFIYSILCLFISFILLFKQKRVNGKLYHK